MIKFSSGSGLLKQVLLFTMIVSLFSFLSTGCGNNNPPATNTAKDSVAVFDPASLKTTIEASDAEFAKAFTSGDSAGMVNHYTQDARIFPPNSPAIIGRPAIAQLVSVYLKFGIKEFKDETTALYGNQDNLIEEGHYFMGDGKGHTIDKGNYVAIWRKVDGEWKEYSNMFNSSLPAAPVK